jgi:hypothetical protein
MAILGLQRIIVLSPTWLRLATIAQAVTIVCRLVASFSSDVDASWRAGVCYLWYGSVCTTILLLCSIGADGVTVLCGAC